MTLKLVGYEMTPREQYQKDLAAYTQRVARGGPIENPPAVGTPVFADDAGNHFVGVPGGDGMAALPFIPGSPARDDSGGFVPVGELPRNGGPDEATRMIAGMAGGLPAQAMAGWAAGAAAQATLGGAPGSGVANALGALGLDNPMGRGAMGGAVAAAANAAGLGRLGSLMGGAIGGGPQGLANALGAQGLSSLANAAGLSAIPGLGPLAGIAGGQLSNLANLLSGGGFSGALDQATQALGDRLGGMDANALTVDENTKNFNLDAVGPAALDRAADQLLSQWQVDDESSAAEHVAHNMVNDNKDAIKEAVSDPDGFMEKVKGMFSGASSDAVDAIVRIADKDDKVDIGAEGVATVLAEGLPVSRLGDKLAPSAKPILQGAALVLTAGLPTARVTSATAVPSVMATGAPTVLVGGPGASVDPPAEAPEAETQENDAPQGPDAPEQPESGSGGDHSNEERAKEGAEQGDSAPGEAGEPREQSEEAQPESNSAPVEETPESSEQTLPVPSPSETSPETHATPSDEQSPDDATWREGNDYRIKQEQDGNKTVTTIEYDNGKTVVTTEEVVGEDSSLWGLVKNERKFVTTQTLDEYGNQNRIEEKYVDEVRIGGNTLGLKYSQEAGTGGSMHGGLNANLGTKISTGVYVDTGRGEDYLGVTVSKGAGGGATNSRYGEHVERSVNTPFGGIDYKDLPTEETLSAEVGLKPGGVGVGVGVESSRKRSF